MSLILPTDVFSIDGKEDELRLQKFGFKWGDKGTHTSRTIMLSELRAVLGCCQPDANRGNYLSAIQEDNCLGKRTTATRKLSSQRLSELYALDPEVPLFRIMRQCWYADRDGQPLIALLLCLARDPLLRVTAKPVLRMKPGEELVRQQMTDALNREVKSRLNESTLDKVVRNAGSSWTQSGHLDGRVRKVRRMVKPTVASATFALLLGYLTGSRGTALFETFWAKVLDTAGGDLIQLASDARRLGLLDMSHSGGVVDVAFSRLLGPDERR